MGETPGFSELELDALREIMNVGFGQAASSLSEIIGFHVILSVPKIALVPNEAAAAYVVAENRDPAALSMVEQFFFGRFSGTSILLIPEGDGRKLLSIFGDQGRLGPEDIDFDSLERDVLLEIGNIIIGACVGKIAEMLGDVVRYEPPRFASRLGESELAAAGEKFSGGLALVFKTLFHFEKQNVVGYLFIVTTQESVRWLKEAIEKFLAGLS